MSWLIYASPAIGALCYLILAVEYSLVLRGSGVIFLIAFLYSSLWSRFPGLYFPLDFVQAGVWSACFIVVLTRETQRRPSSWHFIWLIPAVSLAGAVSASLRGLLSPPVDFYFYLICCVGTLLVTEQLVRSETGLTKTIGISVGGLMLLNLYIYANALIHGQIYAELIETRQLANATIAILLCVAPLTTPAGKRTRRIGLSRPLIFTTTSLVLAGSVLIGIAILGYVLRLGEYAHGKIIQQFSLFVIVLVLGFYLSSPANRAKAKVWINKHFFRTKHDYNGQWRALSEHLSKPDGRDDYVAIAIEAVANIYHCTAGACYVADGDQFVPVEKMNITGQLATIVTTNAPIFFEKMRDSNWIYIHPTSDPGLGRFNESIPHSLIHPKESLLILPLINDATLIAFIVVYGEFDITENFDYEDLDLLRMVGKQISSFVGYQMLHEERLVTLQFEAFHQFTTFVMHDLKNLIAQQALVVENARRFINNPEFVSDAVKTIENSVARMNRLIRKINENKDMDTGGTQLEPVDIVSIVEEAVVRCSGNKPVPVLQSTDEAMLVHGDHEALVMAFTHLVSNAQDACTGKAGRVEVLVARQGDGVECRVTDNGVGMDEDFIKRRLYKPFDSSKSSKGMGIGAYQCKRILSKIGGTISVESSVGEGTCFTVRLPLAQTASI